MAALSKLVRAKCIVYETTNCKNIQEAQLMLRSCYLFTVSGGSLLLMHDFCMVIAQQRLWAFRAVCGVESWHILLLLRCSSPSLVQPWSMIITCVLFLGGHFLFICSDTFAVGIII